MTHEITSDDNLVGSERGWQEVEAVRMAASLPPLGSYAASASLEHSYELQPTLTTMKNVCHRST